MIRRRLSRDAAVDLLTRAQSMPKTVATLFALAATLTTPTPALAQRRMEVSFSYWLPHADIVVAADGVGAPGTAIDLRQDTSLTDGSFPDLAVSFRPAIRHTFRFEFLPISFDSTSALPRGVVFNGVTYARGVSVSSRFDWTTVRFGYQYDFIVRPRWTLGVVVEGRQTVIEERLASGDSDQIRRSQVPVPAAGGAVTFRASARTSIMGEFVGIKVPNSADRHYGGHYADLLIVGTLDLASHIGAQGGYRLVDIGHLGETDSATMTLRGFYAGVVVRR
jgi:hypothetical protein